MNLEKLTLPLEVDSKAFNAGLGVAVAGIAAVVSAVSLAVKATFTWADELDSIQDVIGGTNEEAAALNFTLRKSGTSTETFNKSLVIMNKGLIKADGSLDTVGKAMADWGIDVKDVNGELKPQSKLIDEVAKKYASFGTQQEKINFLTEVFGKGGAEMVDFFDTLAADGGIDAVTQKVKDLGLAIDPQRYENFNRNLEEMKLAGLGVAVALTEKLMPVFEDFLTYVNSFRGLSLSEALDTLTSDFMNAGAIFSDWAKSIDWAQVSADLITGINSIDWATLGSNVNAGFRGIFEGLVAIVSGIDWGGLLGSIGTAFADFIVGLAGGDNWASVKAVWMSNMTQLGQIVSALLNRVKDSFTQKLYNIKSAVTTTFANIRDSIKNAIQSGVSSALGFIDSLINGILSIPVVGSLVGTTGGGIGGGSITTPRASGGYSSGLTLVGENGMELVDLPSGSYVNNAVSSRAMMNQPVKAYIDYDELARTMGRVFGQQLQRA